MRRSCCSCRCCCLSEWCSSLCRAASLSSWALSITRRRGSLVCSGWPRAGDGGPAPRTRGGEHSSRENVAAASSTVRSTRSHRRESDGVPLTNARVVGPAPSLLPRRRGSDKVDFVGPLERGTPRRSEMVRSRLSPPRSLRRSPNRRGARCPLGRRRRTCSDTLRHPALSHGRDRLLDEPGGLRPGRSALLAAGAADAGIVVCGAHSIGLLRDLASRHGLIRRVAVSAFGDPVYRTLARRWSRVMLTLFAVGVITGTVLSFEMGLLWPNFTGTFGERVRPRVRDRGLLVLHRGDLHRHLRVRVGPAVPAGSSAERDPDRDHRVHRVADGDLGQRLDEPPGRVSSARRQGARRRPLQGAVREHAICGTS